MNQQDQAHPASAAQVAQKLLPISLFLLLAIAGPYALLRARTNAAAQITEDDPRWDCRTMGNKVCGPSTYAPEPLYVAAHEGHFDAVNMAGVMLSEFDTRAQLETYAKDKGFQLIDGSYPQASANQTVKPVYLCGALTKKGTPCKHRVKREGERCWQHKGK